MTDMRDAFGPVFLSTDHLPEKNRDELVREFCGRSMMRFDVTPQGDAPASFNASAYLLPQVSISHSVTTPVISERTQDLIVDGLDDIFLSVGSDDYAVSVGGDTTEIAAGGAFICSLDRKVRIERRATTVRTVQIKRSALAPLVSTLDTRGVNMLRGDNAAWHLLDVYIRQLQQADLSSAALRNLVTNHVIDLAALAIGATRDVAEIAQGRGVRAARLAAIKAEIAANLQRPGLSAETVAGRLRMSSRYLRKLFETEGTSFSDFVTARRLAKVHRMLTDPRHLHRKIADLAFEVGFNEIATFNRAFRSRYGTTPSNIRAAALRVDPDR